MRGVWVLTAGIIAVALWIIGAAISREPDGFKVGILDSARLVQNLQGMAELRRPYDEQRRAYLELINLRQNFLMLSGLEWANLRLLLSKPQRTRREEEQLQQLRRTELEREAELQRLQQTPSAQLSPQEKARLEELSRLWKEGREDLERLKEVISNELKRVEEAISKALDEKLRQAIKKVAFEQNLDLVLDKAAVYFVRGQTVDIMEAVSAALSEMAQNPITKSEKPQDDKKEEKP